MFETALKSDDSQLLCLKIVLIIVIQINFEIKILIFRQH